MAFPSWGWVTNLRVRVDSPEDLIGKSFTGADTYKAGYSDPQGTSTYTLGFNDGGGNGRIGHIGSPGYSTGDGIDIDGERYDVSRHWTFDVRVNYSDGTSHDVSLMAFRVGYLESGKDRTSGEHTGATVFRIHDDAIGNYFEGPDGQGPNQYSMDEIGEIEILDYSHRSNARALYALRKPYPDDGDDSEAAQDSQTDEVPPYIQGPQADEVPPYIQGPQADEVPPYIQGPQADEVPPYIQGPQEDDAPLRADCLVTGTLVETAAGQHPIETLRVGDLVADHG